MSELLSLPLPRAIVGAAISLVVARAAWGGRALTGGGAAAAAVVGTLAIAADWTWGALLMFFFVTSALLGRARRARSSRGEEFEAKPGARDAVQVLANGGLLGGGAVALLVAPHPVVAAAALGALAAATGDTWATEVGIASKATAHSLRTRAAVPAGASGAVTLAGTAAGVLGATAIGAGALLTGVPPAAAFAVAVGGAAGLVADSLAGAWLQGERWCASCARATERSVHTCGARTTHARGWRWLDNDGVNVLATLTGAVVAGVVADGFLP
jgi:uncharacterized protein (TIGR00297 family)